MSALNKKIYLTSLLLFIYIGYYGTVSLFVHSHVYNGVVYLHSHPYDRSTPGEDRLPIESHHHTAGTFFTLNQISAVVSSSTKFISTLEILLPSFKLFFNESSIINIIGSTNYILHLRAPPRTSSF